MKVVKVGVIGCGSIAFQHLKRLLEVDSIRIVAACDTNQSALDKFGHAANIPAKNLYRDYQLLLKQSKSEAVLINLPTRLHSIVAVEAFEAGKHVFCEKPVALNLAKAEKMFEAARKCNLKLQIGLHERFREKNQVLKRHITNGELGEIYYARCGYLRRSGIPGWGSWFTRKKDAGAGPVFDIGSHVLDLTLWLMANFKPSTAYASTYAKFGPEKKNLGGWGKAEDGGYFDVEDLACALLKMQNDASISFEVSWASHTARTAFYINLMGDKAGLDLESASVYTNELGGQVDKKLYFDDNDPYAAEMKHFANCILNNEEPLTKPDEMLGLQAALDMILKSAAENKVISMNEV